MMKYKLLSLTSNVPKSYFDYGTALQCAVKANNAKGLSLSSHHDQWTESRMRRERNATKPSDCLGRTARRLAR